MASVILTTAATALAPANPFLGAAFQAGARFIGGQIDNLLLGGAQGRSREGARLADLSVQSSTYGKMIPIVYGNVRIAGNVIWSRPIKEVATTTTTTQGGKGGGGASSSTTEFSYYVTLAIAICEGPVDAIQRAWADAEQLDLSLGTYRFYTGDEAQLPDPLIESYEGIGSTPAYRGLSYVVIEDFPLADYGNRIPNFTFEVKKKALWPDVNGEPVEHMVQGMILIPGSGEFVYDTQIQHKVEGEPVGDEYVQQGNQQVMNMHNPFGQANALLALDQLEETCPNAEWIGLVVNWFGDNLDAGSCVIKPGVEFAADQATTAPEVWSSAGYTRATARQITYVGNAPRYGGTPDDESVLRLCSELKSRGYKIFFYPIFLMDVEDKPWRGRVTGSVGDVADFFTKAEGYNAFILHYANLVKDTVDAFAIGTEMIGLTTVNDGALVNRQFPAVDALISLAGSVRGIVGANIQVTYAADWSEYHHAEGGWYHLDPLWASPDIDFVGIDAYFPITNAPQNELGYDIDTVVDGWSAGEGYDFYYVDVERTTTAPLDPPYAWKNIDWWWQNTHTNPDGNVTSWTPQAKKIWFTEYGFPSVDGATNQPNVFYDPTSSESFFPHFSRGRVDLRAQRTGVAGTLAKWQDSAMVERLFLWTWDARPYPYWPDLRSVWADGPVWKTGHWVQGKFGLSSLAAIVADIARRAGVDLSRLDVSRLQDQVDGYVIDTQASARSLIEELMTAYFFDVAETDGQLKFIPRGNASVHSLMLDELMPRAADEAPLEIIRAQELELPQSVAVQYLNRLANYQTGTQRAQRQVTPARDEHTIGLPIVMTDQRARSIADVALYQAWLSRTQYQFDAPIAYADLEPTDVITVQAGSVAHVLRITRMQLGRPGMLRITGVAEDVVTYDFYSTPGEAPVIAVTPEPVAETRARLLDLPALASDAADQAMLRFAAAGLADNWRGATIYRSDDGGQDYARLVSFTQACVMGTAVTALADGPTQVFDRVATCDVVLLGQGELFSASELAVLNGANLAVIGDELIQFSDALALGANKYRLSGLLRGRLGSEWATPGHSAGEGFVLLDARLQKDVMPDGLIGLGRDYKAVSTGLTPGVTPAQPFTYHGRALKPYAPVHVRGTRDTEGNLTIRWVRRTRVGGEWRDYTDAALSEAREAYEVAIQNGADVVRTLSSYSPEAVYGAAQQAADFGSVQQAVSITVYQLSDRVGLGYGAQAVI